MFSVGKKRERKGLASLRSACTGPDVTAAPSAPVAGRRAVTRLAGLRDISLATTGEK